MGGFYALVLAVYLLFEALPVSFRPILVNGKLEASYPSSHTVLVLCVMGTALLYLHSMEGRCPTRLLLGGACLLAMVLTVLGRLLSGVHWCTDVIGGVLVSSGLVLLYAAAVARLDISGIRLSSPPPREHRHPDLQHPAVIHLGHRHVQAIGDEAVALLGTRPICSITQPEMVLESHSPFILNRSKRSVRSAEQEIR